MEKFYDLIPKQEVKEFCQETNYKLDSLQCIYLVWRNKELPIDIKHNLYSEIMSDMEDRQVAYYHQPSVSLFEALKEHMKLERKIQSCLSDSEINLIHIKSWLSKYLGIYYRASFPTPFRKGDILYCSNKKTSPFALCVFDSITEDSSRSEVINEMAAVYRITAYGDIIKDYENTSQLKVFCGELAPKDRIYQALSDCIKGKISPAALLHAHYIYTTSQQNTTRISSPISFFDEDCKYVEELFEIKNATTAL